jgi:hypothetical protein
MRGSGEEQEFCFCAVVRRVAAPPHGDGRWMVRCECEYETGVKRGITLGYAKIIMARG